MTEEILKVSSLKKYFVTKQGVVKAVDNVSFSIKRAETYGLVGESGSGKTTVAHTIVGIHQPTEGEIFFKGNRISEAFSRRPKNLKKDIRIVYQDPASSLNPRRNVKQILELPLKVHRIGNKTDLLERVKELMSFVELPCEYMYKYPQSLGGGEKQMIAIARALASKPSFIVLDEPTSALDVSVQAKIINLLMKLQLSFNLTYLFITHDLSLVRNMANRVAIMYLGKINEVAPTAEFFRNPLHPYTKMLLSSIPVVSEDEEVLKPKTVISKGEIPSSINVPAGCGFHLRCPEKIKICSKVDPAMVEAEKNHFVRCHLYSK